MASYLIVGPGFDPFHIKKHINSLNAQHTNITVIYESGLNQIDCTSLNIKNNSNVKILAHGNVDYTTGQHITNLCKNTPTSKDVIQSLTRDKSIHIELISCFSGTKINDTAKYLAPGSTLITFASDIPSFLVIDQYNLEQRHALKHPNNPFVKFAHYLFINPDDTKFAIGTQSNSYIFESKISDIKGASIREIKEWQIELLDRFLTFCAKIQDKVEEHNRSQIEILLNLLAEEKHKHIFLNQFDVETYKFLLGYNHASIKLVRTYDKSETLKQITDDFFATVLNKLNIYSTALIPFQEKNLNYEAILLSEIHCKSKFINTWLSHAIDHGMSESLKSILALIKLQKCNINGMSGDILNGINNSPALSRAAFSTNPSMLVAQLLIEAGAYTYPGLIHDAASSGNLDLLAYCIKSGINIDSKDPSGQTPLHRAAYLEKLDVVNYLAEAGAKIDAQDEYNRTPLHYAAAGKNLSAVISLIQYGANPNLQDIIGHNALHRAITNDTDDIVIYLASHSNVNAQDKKGLAPLHYAATKGNIQQLKILIKSGANINIQDLNGKSPLHKAIERNHHNVVEFFIKNGSNPNLKDQQGYTLLDISSSPENSEITRCLVQAGADINAKHEESKTTPLYHAIMHVKYSNRPYGSDCDLSNLKNIIALGSDINPANLDIYEKILSSSSFRCESEMKKTLESASKDQIKFILENQQEAKYALTAMRNLEIQQHMKPLHHKLMKVEDCLSHQPEGVLNLVATCGDGGSYYQIDHTDL